MKKVLGYIALALALQGCATMGKVLGDKEMIKAGQDMTPKQEYYLGRSVAAQILSTNPHIADPKVMTYINTIGQYLALHSERATTFKGYRFAVVKSKVPTALSAPGGYIFISTGLISELQSEDELAGVLAHEIAHIGEKHANHAIKAKNQMATATKWGAKILSLATDGEVSEETVNFFGSAVSEVVDITYSKDQEIDADLMGVDIMRSAGYDPAAILEFLKRLKTDAGLLSKHPRSPSRINQIQKKLSTQNWTGEKKARSQRFNDFKKKVQAALS